jgi:hypothetical protein
VASTTTVKRALAALAEGRGFVSRGGGDDRTAERAVTDAETALERLDTAADFRTEGGERRLRQVVGRAERRGRRRLARRGQRVLATLDRFRAAADDTDSPVTGNTGQPADPSPRRGATARETVKRTGGQPPDR